MEYQMNKDPSLLILKGFSLIHQDQKAKNHRGYSKNFFRPENGLQELIYDVE